MARMTNGWRLAAAAAFSLLLNGGAYAQEADAKADARMMFEEALKQKKTGKLDDAIKTFEKAIRKDRSVLSEDDDGLVGMLRNSYLKQLASAPEDVQILEGLGFISAVCDSNGTKAIEYYSKITQLTKDEGVRARTQQLIDRLKAQVDATKQQSEDFSSRSREERLKTWSEMEKNDALAAQSEINTQREGRLAELYRTREEKEARIPQLEDEVGNLDEEADRWKRMYLSTNDRRYKRKEDKADADVESKKKEIERLKVEIEKTKQEIDKLTKEDPTAVASKVGTASGSGDGNGSTMTPDDPNASANPSGVMVSPDDPTVVRPDGTTGLGSPQDPSLAPAPGTVPASGTDPALPPANSPDFPPDPGSEPASGAASPGK